MRGWERFALIMAAAATTPVALASCRGIAGIRSLRYEAEAAADAGTDGIEGDDGGCAGGPQVLGTTPNFLDAVKLQGGYLYYELPASPPSGPATSGGVVRCPTGGCKSPDSVITNKDPNGLTWGDYDLGPQGVYYALEGLYTQGGAPDGGDLFAPGMIGLAGFDGGNPHTFANAFYPTFLAILGTDLFWFDDPVGGGDPNADAGTWLMCPLTGCSQTDSGAPGQPWVTDVGSVFEVFSDTNNLYFVAEPVNSPGGSANLYACSRAAPCGSLSGSGPKPLVTGIDDTATDPNFGFTSDGTYVYGTYAALAGGIVRIDQTGMATTLVTGQVTPHSFAVDGAYLYWVGGGAAIYRIRTDGSSMKQPETVIENQANADNLAFDAQYLYYTDQLNSSTFQLLRMCK